MQYLDNTGRQRLGNAFTLEGRVKGRMALMDANATGEENVLESKASGKMNDLRYRRQQNDEQKDPKDTNPTFPYYVVYVTADGSNVTKHTQPKAALDLMRAACSGGTEPLLDLCRTFNDETRDGTRMDAYTDPLDDVVGTITDVQETKGMESLFSLGEVGSGVSLGFDNYSLVSFVVLRQVPHASRDGSLGPTSETTLAS